MKRRLPTAIKDGAKGLAMGSAVIVPGISGGTIALITGAFKKIVSAVDGLFSKNFWRNLVILIPFGIGAILAVAALIIPFQLAFEYCMFSIVCLFAGLIIGSVPGITDEIKGKQRDFRCILSFVISLIFAGIIGVLSVIFNFRDTISGLFSEVPFWLYFVLLAVGIVSSTGLIVPGFSGSMLLLVLGFYQPILNLVHLENFWRNLSLLAVFAIGVLIGFILFSKIMNHFLTKHRTGTYHAIIGFILGSLISIFVNSNMFAYFKNSFGLLDQILGPILLVVGVVLSYFFVLYTRKHKELENA